MSKKKRAEIVQLNDEIYVIADNLTQKIIEFIRNAGYKFRILKSGAIQCYKTEAGVRKTMLLSHLVAKHMLPNHQKPSSVKFINKVKNDFSQKNLNIKVF